VKNWFQRFLLSNSTCTACNEARKEAAASEAAMRTEIASLNGKLAEQELKTSSASSALAAAERATRSEAAAAAAADADAKGELVKLRAELLREKTREEQGAVEVRTLKARVDVAEAEVAEARSSRAAARATAGTPGAAAGKLTSKEEIAHMVRLCSG
jgi:chromosome segregation ATPase